MARYEKLVRDGIPAKLDQKGVPYEKRIASDAEYKAELVKKLVEEAKEFEEAADIEELADVLEVVAALRELPEFAEAEAVRLGKREERGGFEERFILAGDDGK